MPTYEYQCKNCGHHFEELQFISEPPLVKCPKCGKDTLVRLIGAGGGVIFKGSGFYLTDYKKNHKEKDKTTKKAGTSDKPDTKSETKSAAADNKTNKKESKKK